MNLKTTFLFALFFLVAFFSASIHGQQLAKDASARNDLDTMYSDEVGHLGRKREEAPAKAE